MAGFEVYGVDVKEQPRYPGEHFFCTDALEYLRDYGCLYDAIHASPPCQHYANVTRWRGRPSDHPDLLAPTREILIELGVPYVIENVVGAPMRPDYILCGSMFGLKVRRHRWFETSFGGGLVYGCDHRGLLPFEHKGERAYADAMGCPWMTNREGREAIPPAYTEFIGRDLLVVLQRAA
jgi:hypothetical protein